MNTALAYRRPSTGHKGISTYQQNQILNLNANELILKLYDLAILSIKKEDIKKANQAIAELIAALNFDYQEVAMGLFRLYRYCQDCLYQKKYDDAINIMEELRNSWAQAFNL